MFKALTFRKKVILSQAIAFLVFFSILFPFIEKMASALIEDSLIESTQELKDRLQTSGTEKELIQSLKRQEFYSFFRMGLINEKGIMIFDSQFGRIKGEAFTPYKPTDHGEIAKALEEGVGYAIADSETFRSRFAYVAESFLFQGENYLLWTAFPYQQVEDLTEHFQLGVLVFSFIILLFFNGIIWFIFNRLTSPIREIIHSITPYQTGVSSELPEITLSRPMGPEDDFQRLAQAFNSLSKRIQEQIDVLMSERNEKGAILESLGEGVVAVDASLSILYINFTACKMLGVVSSKMVGHPLRAEGLVEGKFNGRLIEGCSRLLRRAQEMGVVVTDSIEIGKEKKKHIDLVAAPKAHGEGAILVLQDKTSHYRVLEMGKDFIANASHELRTPITIIKGYAETLRDMPDLSKEHYTDITEKIGRNCARMESLVKSLLTLADIENLPENMFKEFDLKTLIENCRYLVRSVCSDAQIEIDFPKEKVSILGDASLIELAIVNLLDNAAKYSEAPAKIDILVKKRENQVEIAIRDQGKGIPKGDVEQIFGRFYRVDKTHSRKLGGAGLGLSIVKTIIDKHDGEITAHSILGKGTTFTICLPTGRLL